MYLSSQNNTYVTIIHYRILWEIATENYRIKVKRQVYCTEFNKFNALPISNKYPLKEPPGKSLKT
jgi:hypothetical protein